MSKIFEMKVSFIDRSKSYGDSRLYLFSHPDHGNVFRVTQCPFPECCGVAILKNFSVSQELKVEEFNECMGQLVQDLQKNDLFSKIVLFTNTMHYITKLFGNYPGMFISEKFVNRRTCNELVGMELSLIPEVKKEEAVPIAFSYRQHVDEEELSGLFQEIMAGSNDLVEIPHQSSSWINF